MQLFRPNRVWLLLLPLACLALPACQQKMAVQPSARPDDRSDFFPDGVADRQLVPGTIARGHLRSDLHFFTGRNSSEPTGNLAAAALLGNGSNVLGGAALAALNSGSFIDEADYATTFPFPITQEVLEHGQNRYLIYCIVCHDARGTGHGKIVERGYTQPPSYHVERLRQAPVGKFFAVITEGYGSMPDYRQQIPPRDRWAIAAYIRALQLSQHFPRDEMTPEMKEKFENRAEPTRREGAP